MSRKVQLAISTCPNDTFAFHALLTGEIIVPGIELEIELLDIQQLNDGLFSGQFDLAKASFHAAILLAKSTLVLPSGAAIGFGVGPLLLAAAPNQSPATAREATDPRQVTLCPGQHTTAALLFRLFYGNRPPIRQIRFSEIMPALQTGQFGFGVCIHEGRFTWQQQGLHLVEDLGERWESETGFPLPLGGILARRDLPHDVTLQIQNAIQASIEFGMNHREQTLPTMRKYAQEFDDDVLFQHVDLYVNDWTLDLEQVGRDALAKLSEMAVGVIGPDAAYVPIEVFE